MSEEWKEIVIEVARKQDEPFRYSAKQWGSEEAKSNWLVLHGWLDSASSFDMIAPMLLERISKESRLVCLDVSGHGYSDTRNLGSYHIVDSVADALLAVEALGWGEFGIIGHSMGQGIGTLLSGTFPERVTSFVMIEGLGPSTTPTEKTPDTLKRSLTSYLKGPRERKTYSLEKAAQRRVEGNVAGAISFESTMVLASRGTSPVDFDRKSRELELTTESGMFKVYKVTSPAPSLENTDVYWNSDEGWYIPSRLRLSEPMLLSFMGNISCPVLLILAKDGLFPYMGAKPTYISSFFGRSFVFGLYAFSWALSCIPWVKNTKKVSKMYEGFRQLRNLGIRFTTIRNLRYHLLAGGGHHPHLDKAYTTEIAEEIADFINDTQ